MTCYDVITFRRLLMTLPKDGRKLDQNEINSIKNAVEEAGIPQIHPDKMESFAEHLVQKARNQEPTPWRTGSPLEDLSLIHI